MTEEQPERRVVGTSGGREVTEEDIDQMVREAEAGYDVDEILRRRGATIEHRWSVRKICYLLFMATLVLVGAVLLYYVVTGFPI